MKSVEIVPAVARRFDRVDTFARERLSTLLGERGLTILLLSFILIFGFYLRTSNVNWDKSQHLHPDERFLAMVSSDIKAPASVGQYFNSAESPLNPYNRGDSFVYGTFPLFLNKFVAEWLDKDPDGSTHMTADWFRSIARPFGVDMERPDGSFTFDGGYDSNLVGRVLSAIADTLTILLVFEMGRLLFSRRVGFLAAILLSLTALHLQYSHFFGSETWIGLFVTAVIYFSVRIGKYDSLWNYVGAGIFCGLAFSTKLNALPVLGIPALAILLKLWPTVREYYDAVISPIRIRAGPQVERFAKPILGGILLLVAMGVVFRIAQPYAFNGPGFFDVVDISLNLKEDVFSITGWMHLEPINPTNYFSFSEKFTRDINSLRAMQTGSDFPPNVQWIGRSFIIFPLSNIVLWGMGIPLAAAALSSLAYCIYRMVRRADLTALLLVVWIIGYFFFSARGFNPTMRYFIAIYPSLIVLAAFGLVSLWDYARSRDALTLLRGPLAVLNPYMRLAFQGAVVVAVAGAVLWGLAFMGVYRQDISRVQASEWIGENVPKGSVLASQEWDDGLPLNLPDVSSRDYKGIQFKPYIPDSREKVEELVQGLDETDYIIESSNRLYDSIPRFPARYPSTVLYYQYLFDGTLGFEKVGDFNNYPNLLGIDIPDQSSEEAFTVYDHPRVIIWKKTSAYSHDRALQLLQPDRAEASVNLPPGKAAQNGLMLRPDDLATQQNGGTWTDIFSSSGIAHTNPTLVWLLAIQVMAFAVTPLTLMLFKRLPDRGYLLAKPLGLLLLGYPVWLIVSLKLVHFEQSTLMVVLGLLLLAGAAIIVRNAGDVAGFVREHWRLILFCEVVFLLAFFFAREVRMLNPDLWHPGRGGEKPMDMAYFTAITRSTTLPPYDPWFAGGYINYYYLGQYFAATLSKLTTVPPEVAYNLAVPTFFAFTVAGAFSISYNLAALARKLMRRGPGFRRLPGWSLYAAGVLGAFFVALAGNLDGFGQLSDNFSAVSAYHLNTGIPVFDSLANSAGGIWQVLFQGAELRQFDFWRPSRMMPPQISITEFPQFSFLFADLHAHMIAIPFEVLALGTAAAIALSPRGERGAWREWCLVALMALIVGSLRWINSWDYPPFLLIGLASIVIGERLVEGGSRAASLRLVAKCFALLALSYLFYKPFSDNYMQPLTGIEPTPELTPPHQYLAHFGVFLFLMVFWVGYLMVRAWKASPMTTLPALFQNGPAGDDASRRFVQKQVWLSFALGIVGAITVLSLGLWVQGKELIALLLPFLVVVTYLAVREFRLMRPDGGLRLLLLMLIGLGLGLSAGVDLIVLKGDIVRMNTVFKFYLHIWVVFALVSAFASWYLLFIVWRPRRVKSVAAALIPAFGKAAFAVLVLGALIYPVLATPARIDDRFAELPATLDGTAYMAAGAIYNDQHGNIELEKDLQGIRWMRENVQGTPTIVEGRIDLYRWGSRFSIYTGLPAVLGWDWHQTQQRGDLAFLVDQRRKEVDDFYRGTNVSNAVSFLAQYNVKYVIVGQVEKFYYPEAGLLKFENGLNGRLTEVFSNSELSIYEVKGSTALAPASP